LDLHAEGLLCCPKWDAMAFQNETDDVRYGRERAVNHKRAAATPIFVMVRRRTIQGLGETMEYLLVQLKVCEGCGSLWFRTTAEDVYGRCCAGKLSQHAKANPEPSRRGRRAKHSLHVLRGGGA
jgi:hypothetical protein